MNKNFKSSIVVLSLFFVVAIIAINNIWKYDANAQIPELNAINIVDPDSMGKTFKLETIVIDAYEIKNKLTILSTKNKSNIKIDVPIFANLGKLHKMPGIGDKIIVVGRLGKYKGNNQLKPRSKDDIKIESSGESMKSIAIPLRDVKNHIGDKAMIGPVRCRNCNFFTSKSGKTHLRFVVEYNNNTVNGIFFESPMNKKRKEILDSQNTFYIFGKISEYRGKPSIVGNHISK